ncbi:dicarboxylate transporter/tellurite-resistance protein TehA [Duganella sp. FT135W]|uniref:Dicarboxylate transporter/tellurite-resistance protein TehA n=1 Tax=Duganella flavida TaxID=2692175 RepID=A0A6L8K6N9_9BURK|nr:dicarboxylate transporter/tellurite-resistance protein TehA [Duganella flavida]MYM22625.1 dicarboxylate transporter/tellurite-resistance protein TehA [Duganella flavida]
MSDQIPVPAALPALPSASRSTVSVTHFSMILGLSGLGYALLNAAKLWGIPPILGELELEMSFAIWCALVLRYQIRLIRQPRQIIEEYHDPVSCSIASLIGVSTLVFVPAAAAYSLIAAWSLAIVGIAWHLGFSAWHTARLWRGNRNTTDTTPALYLPDVAGNFTSAAALGVLGQPDWAWLFLGAGLFSWLSLEPVIKASIIHGAALAPARRPLMGIQAAPAVVCAASVLFIEPHIAGPWVMLLLGYGLYQLIHGLRLTSWLKEQPFTRSYWAYTFGMTSALNCCLKLALGGSGAARVLAVPLMAAVSSFIVYLGARTLLSR